MGFWGVGPFDNDDAADFANDLDDETEQGRIELVGRVLERVATDDDPDVWDAPRAVAAAALVASQCPGGQPVCSAYGPSTRMPQFPTFLKDLAVTALERVVAPQCWLADDWADASAGLAWRQTVDGLRKVLEPPQAESLFEL